MLGSEPRQRGGPLLRGGCQGEEPAGAVAQGSRRADGGRRPRHASLPRAGNHVKTRFFHDVFVYSSGLRRVQGNKNGNIDLAKPDTQTILILDLNPR